MLQIGFHFRKKCFYGDVMNKSYLLSMEYLRCLDKKLLCNALLIRISSRPAGGHKNMFNDIFIVTWIFHATFKSNHNFKLSGGLHISVVQQKAAETCAHKFSPGGAGSFFFFVIEMHRSCQTEKQPTIQSKLWGLNVVHKDSI